MEWRNLYFQPDHILLKIAKKYSIKILIDQYENRLWVKSTEDNYNKILDVYCEKKGMVFSDHIPILR